MVNEYKARRIAFTRFKWQALRAGTVAATAGAGIFFMFFEDYSGIGGTGEHCFNGVRCRRGIPWFVDLTLVACPVTCARSGRMPRKHTSALLWVPQVPLALLVHRLTATKCQPLVFTRRPCRPHSHRLPPRRLLHRYRRATAC